MARVVAVFDDLLLGSNVLGGLRAAGHDATLAAPGSDVPSCDVLVVDLGSSGFDGVEAALRMRGEGTRLLGVYSHVHADQRAAAEEAGFDLVVPRSRMAREGAALVDRLASA